MWLLPTPGADSCSFTTRRKEHLSPRPERKPLESHSGWLPLSLAVLTPYCGQEGMTEKSLMTSVQDIVGMDQSTVMGTTEMAVTWRAVLITFLHLSVFLEPSILNSFLIGRNSFQFLCTE